MWLCNLTVPDHSSADGELYAGTVSNFQGNEPIIYKSLSLGAALKTENSLNWLQGKSQDHLLILSTSGPTRFLFHNE